MMQSETERQFYLGMAGVRLWYARDPLPGAAPSPGFSFPEDDQPSVGDPALPAKATAARPSTPIVRPDAGNQTAGAARVANLQALMDSPSAPATRTAQNKPRSVEVDAPEAEDVVEPVVELQASTEGEPVPDLNLQIWMGREISIIASLSEEASLRLQEALAQNILKSLGEPVSRSVGPIRWPVFNNRRAPGNALSDLRAVLRYALTGVEGQKLINLGVVGSADREGDEDWLQQLSGCRVDVSFPNTLAELASNPTLKRALWQEIKPLAGK